MSKCGNVVPKYAPSITAIRSSKAEKKLAETKYSGVALGLRKCIGVAGLPHYSFGTLSVVGLPGFRCAAFVPCEPQRQCSVLYGSPRVPG